VLFSADLTRQRILEANAPGLGSPTHGTFLGQTFYFVANTGWDAVSGAVLSPSWRSRTALLVSNEPFQVLP
jgi:hypothetical protein